MKKGMNLVVALACGWSLAGSGTMAGAQTLERDTTITGPRGRTIERQVEIQRRPGMIDRNIQIKRPGGTFDRNVLIQRSPAIRPGPMPGPWGRPAWIGPRPLVIAQPAPAFGFGLMAAPFLNFSFGGGGGMGLGGGGMGLGGGMGGPPAGAAPGQAAPPPPDQVALMCQRLQNFYPGSRKEAAFALGHLGDPRAVPSLIHVLKYDNFKDVRVAAAIALGEIGGSDAAVALERSSIYDHREDVRKAATTALDRLNTKAQAEAARMQQQGASLAPGEIRPNAARPPAAQPPVAAAPASTPSPFRGAAPADRSAGEPPADETAPDLSAPRRELTPPPPPTPVTSGADTAANP